MMDIYDKYLIVSLVFILAVGVFLTWAVIAGKSKDDQQKHKR